MNCQIQLENLVNFQAQMSFPVEKGFFKILTFKEGLKVSKFQKQIFLFSFEPKNERSYFLISALASKNG